MDGERALALVNIKDLELMVHKTTKRKLPTGLQVRTDSQKQHEIKPGVGISKFLSFFTGTLMFFSVALCQPVYWNLIWNDEFEGSGSPDQSKWGYEEGYVRNNEAQYYTRERTENSRQEDGFLILEARRDNWQGNEISSASITTRNTATWKYVRIDVRAKLPTGNGTWPAIWTLGINRENGGWPNNGEIDIMEYVGFSPERIHWNIHTGKYNHRDGTGKGFNDVIDTPYDNFHVYSIEWFPEKIDFLVDSEVYFTYENEYTGWEAWPFDSENYLLLNLAIGGAWGGQQGIDNNLFPHQYLIDYVRVYEPTDEPVSISTAVPIEQNPLSRFLIYDLRGKHLTLKPILKKRILTGGQLPKSLIIVPGK